ncbi:hypothetical protein M3C36_09010 [Dietzia cinnamea]|uniref:hypothetical protein n=1 Tax=Dietzia TaxID=37914 RepID=UPI000D088368|nr:MULTISPECIES: hypothetical protein [Dietzia]AVM66105.1 hypothetical protein C3V38_16230 [Dietzia sp. oral taxon 368]MCT1885324.1 hypothetical protein [Dietzia cinnamea]
MRSHRLSLNYFTAPAPAGVSGDFWIDYLEDVLIDLSRDDVGDAIANHSAYPLEDYVPDGGKSAVLTWLNEQVAALRHGSRHVEILYPPGLTIDGEPAALVTASDDGIDCASQQATAFAMLAWLVNDRQAQDHRRDFAA